MTANASLSSPPPRRSPIACDQRSGCGSAGSAWPGRLLMRRALFRAVALGGLGDLAGFGHLREAGGDRVALEIQGARDIASGAGWVLFEIGDDLCLRIALAAARRRLARAGSV